MARILIPLPLSDFDPSEVAIPCVALTRAGHEVVFATETGAVGAADEKTLGRDAGPLPPKSLWAHAVNRDLYDKVAKTPAFRDPIRWQDATMADFDAIVFPGGHGPGMRPYCESMDVQRLGVEAFTANKLVGAICHGVLPLARARRADGLPLLAGRRTTSLPAWMERLSMMMTRAKLGDHYRTYPDSVEREVRAAVGKQGAYLRGPIFTRYATQDRPDIGFVVEDGAYLSARWPGDAWTLGQRMVQRLG